MVVCVWGCVGGGGVVCGWGGCGGWVWGGRCARRVYVCALLGCVVLCTVSEYLFQFLSIITFHILTGSFLTLFGIII